MRNTFAYDIDKWIKSEEGQEDLRKTKAEYMRMLDDPKTPKRILKTLPSTIKFIDLYLVEK